MPETVSLNHFLVSSHESVTKQGGVIVTIYGCNSAGSWRELL